MNGNGKDALAFPDSPPRRRWWNVSFDNLLTIIFSLIGAAFVAVGAFYSLEARVMTESQQFVQQDKTNAAVDGRMAKIEDEQAKRRDAEAQIQTSLAVIVERVNEIANHMNEFDDRLDRIESRQVGAAVDDPPRILHHKKGH